MKTKTPFAQKSYRQLKTFLLLGFLLVLFSPHLQAQERLLDRETPMQKGDVYYMDYQIASIYGYRGQNFTPAGPGPDTQSTVRQLIRLEVIQELPEDEYLIEVSYDESSYWSRFGSSYNVYESKYPNPFTDIKKSTIYKGSGFGNYARFITSRIFSNQPLSYKKFSHLKVNRNLIVKAFYESKEKALVGEGHKPIAPTHLWFDFDKLGVFYTEKQKQYPDFFQPMWEHQIPMKEQTGTYNEKYTAPFIVDFEIDKASNWIRYAQFTNTSTKRFNLKTLTTIKAWKGDPKKKTIVEGYLQNVDKNQIRKENLTHNVPYFFDKGRENIILNEDGYFRWEGTIDQAVYFSLRDFNGEEFQKIYCYVQPGDSLYLQGDFKRLDKTLTFGGKNKAANAYLNNNEERPLVGLTEWFGAITLDIENWEHEKINQLVFAQRKYHLERLKLAKEKLDPIFYTDEFWRLKYGISRFIRLDKVETTKVKRTQFLPIINYEAVHLPAYWSYMDYYLKTIVGQNSFNSLTQNVMGTHERYNNAKSFLAGFPQYIVMYHALWEAIRFRKTPPSQLNFMVMEFLEYCQDEKMKQSIQQAYDRLIAIEPGKFFLNFQLLDTLGNKTEMKDLIGKKIVLEPIFRFTHRFKAKDYEKWKAAYPDIHFVQLALFDLPENFTAFKAEQMLLDPPPNVDYLFPSSPVETRKMYAYLGLDSLHLYSRYPKVFLLDEKGKIISQDHWKFEENLTAFAALPSAITPFWKNPIWKIAIPLSLFIGLLTWLGTGFLNQLKRKRLERRRQMVEMELNSIRSQLNPHFVYNTMSSIQNLILSDRSEQASQYLAELAGLMRAVLRQTKKGIISLEEELNTVRQYFKLEALRKSFAWNIKIDEGIDIHNTDIPAMLLQPYVENAILHGLKSKEMNGKIDLTIKRQNGNLDIFIQDNGIGIREALMNTQGGNHLGLQLNRERLKLLYGENAQVSVKDRTSLGSKTSGTQVAISIPT